ncbi:MAG: Fic family protein [Actinomycetota bacterium]
MLFECPEPTDREIEVIGQITEIRQATAHIFAPTRRWLRPLRRTAFARNIQASNSIEGHHVSLDDALAAASDGIPDEADRDDFLAVKNYGDAMTYVISLAEDEHFVHSVDVIRSLHFMMMKHDLGARAGKWRTGPVYVWSTTTNETVYDGPPSDQVPELVAELVAWLNGPGAEADPLLRGAMAHLNLVMIHPFKDGNGRMSRALQSLVLARDHIVAPEFASIEEYLGRNTPAYYDVLAEVGQGSWQPHGDARPWTRFVLTAHLRQADTVRRRLAEADRTWTALSTRVDELGLDQRLTSSVYLAATGRKVRRNDHIELAEVSERVASADLKRLVDIGLLNAVGEKRGRYYIASPEVVEIRASCRETQVTIADPFE